MTMINAFSRGLAQLSDPRIRKVVWIAIGSAFIVFVLLWGAIGTLLGATSVSSIGWLEWVVDLLGGLATLVLTWFLFPAVIGVVIGLYLEDIVDAVETRHYPGLPAPIEQSILPALMVALRYLGVLVTLNLVRRLDPDAARRLRLAHRGELFLAGVVMAFLLTLPLVNLLAPVVITAAMVHLINGWRNSAS
jgi:CysZ protein